MTMFQCDFMGGEDWEEYDYYDGEYSYDLDIINKLRNTEITEYEIIHKAKKQTLIKLNTGAEFWVPKKAYSLYKFAGKKRLLIKWWFVLYFIKDSLIKEQLNSLNINKII